MMSSIFISFDLQLTTQQYHLPTLVYGILVPALFSQMLWSTYPTRLVFMLLSSSVVLTLSAGTKGMKTPMLSSFMNSVFYSLIVMNLSGLAPILFSFTSHLICTLSIALTLWTSMIISSISNFALLKAHMVPENTPTPLVSFLSSVETLSSLIRPITLAFRLAANMSAGHVILSMVSSGSTWSLTSSLKSWTLILCMITISLYASFEVMICLAQAFVLMLLSLMYTNDYTPS